MDWTAFIKDNSQALFTLSGVLLGSIVAIFGNYINNWFQSNENDKTRLEKKKEAKTQLRIDLMRNDIKHIEDVTKLMFESINQAHTLNLKRKMDGWTREKMNEEIQAMITGQEGVIHKLDYLDTITDVLAYLHGEEIYSAHKNTTKLFESYFDLLLDSNSTTHDKENLYEEIVMASAKLQQMLRARLVSVIDA